MIFGYIGFADTTPRESAFDSLYRAVQLFTFGGSTPPHPNTWLEIARFIGPFVVGYAAVRGIIALYREQARAARIRSLRNHGVIAGLGAAGFRMAKAFVERDWRVVVIEQDVTNVAIEGCRERGIGVVTGDASDWRTLRKAGVGRAILLVVMCGNDGANVDVAEASRRVVRDRKKGILTTLVALDDLELWRIMRGQALIDRDGSPMRLELFNVFATAAEMLLDEHPPFSADESQSPHVLVIGTGGVGSSLVAEAVRRWRQEEACKTKPLRITIAGPDADDELGRLLAHRPELHSKPFCELMTWKVDFAAATLESSPRQLRRIYISLPSETESLTLALALRQQAALWDVPIVIAVADEDAGVGASITKGGHALRDVHSFGVLRQSLTPDALSHTTTERIARLTHDLHRERASNSDGPLSDSGVLRWEELEDSLRESNRLFADGIAANLERVGCMVVSAPVLDGQPRLQFSGEEVEALAPLEHERWEQAMKRIGYRYGTEKDHKRKRHPMIGVDWEDLPDDNKEKDRAHVRSIPETLARAGFAVHRIDEMARTGPAAVVEGIGPGADPSGERRPAVPARGSVE